MQNVDNPLVVLLFFDFVDCRRVPKIDNPLVFLHVFYYGLPEGAIC